MKALNFGSMNIDYVYQVAHFVLPGETISADHQQVNCGGKGLNQSIALAKAGVEVYHAGCMGQGGEMLTGMLENNGVCTTYIRSVDAIQGNAMIQVNSEGQNCIILFGGSNQCITKEQITETLQHFCAGDYLLLQNEVNELGTLVDAAYEKGMKIVLNPSPYNEKLDVVDYGKISWILVNEVEAVQLSGDPNPEKAWDMIHGRYPNLSMVLTLGEEGSICYTGEQIIRQKAMKVKAVDTTAAGDTFTGYFVAGLMAGLPLETCMERASIASSISVTRPGAGASIPTKEEVDNSKRVSK